MCVCDYGCFCECECVWIWLSEWEREGGYINDFYWIQMHIFMLLSKSFCLSLNVISPESTNLYDNQSVKHAVAFMSFHTWQQCLQYVKCITPSIPSGSPLDEYRFHDEGSHVSLTACSPGELHINLILVCNVVALQAHTHFHTIILFYRQRHVVKHILKRLSQTGAGVVMR